MTLQQKLGGTLMETNWLKSSIAFEMQNKDYPEDTLRRRFNAVTETASAESIQAVGEALAALHQDDQFLSAELTTKSVYLA
ncbi:hypothetical protein FC69_GL001369 [Latilactobacillus fuchuensis DSM 14340 = JCM 11249]|uniref:DUF1659 domain-containing protein n=2 Tax=Latilactobacillus fuchuensis TaxID=164393 RepID=A0A0R1RSB4_9LACO|nr:hypothetical protein FC69_GL001369 [Latilactobacillus fuchuensis DSM 14340 = JCM 11249]